MGWPGPPAGLVREHNLRRDIGRRTDATDVVIWAHVIASQATFIFLVIEDWPRLNWWNWIIIFPVNQFLSQIWPIYWLVLRPMFG